MHSLVHAQELNSVEHQALMGHKKYLTTAEKLYHFDLRIASLIYHRFSKSKRWYYALEGLSLTGDGIL
jgi:hypothetical protein